MVVVGGDVMVVGGNRRMRIALRVCSLSFSVARVMATAKSNLSCSLSNGSRGRLSLAHH